MNALSWQRAEPPRGRRKDVKKDVKTFWSASDEACLAVVQRAYVEEGRIGQTVRHYYYKLLSSGQIRVLPRPNSGKNAYNFVSRLLSDARMGETLPWGAVVDPGRRAFTHTCYESLAAFLRVKRGAYFPVDVWRGQPRRLEVWVEKDGLAQFAHNAVRDYRVPVHVGKGYGSATVIKGAAERYGTGKGWTLLYAGDFDPSGLDIERNLRDMLRAHGARPEIVRVALTQEDTRQLPQEAALELKRGDSRTKGFVARYGPEQRGYELDALPAGQLRQKLLDAVGDYLDLGALREARDVERAVEGEVEDVLRDVFTDLDRRILREGIPGSGLPLETLRRYLRSPDRDDWTIGG